MTKYNLETEQEQIKKIDTLLSWIGGKHLLSKTIDEYIRNTEHTLYAESFFGMGNVFLKRKHKVECK